MSDFDDYFAETTIPTLKAHKGTAVTYTDEHGTATSCTAVLGEESAEEVPGDKGTIKRREREVKLFKDEVASVSLRGTVTIAGEVWPIEEILGSTAGDALLRCVREEPMEVARPEYRRSR